MKSDWMCPQITWLIIIHQMMKFVYKMVEVTSWWYYDMETLSSLLALCVGNPPITSVLTTEQQYGTLMFCLLLAWPNCWTNYLIASDLRCHDAYVTHNCNESGWICPQVTQLIIIHHIMKWIYQMVEATCFVWGPGRPLWFLSTVIQ